MGHGVTWFSLLPFCDDVEHFFQGITAHGLLFGNAVIAQHVFAGILTTLVIMLMALRARAQLNAAGADSVVPDAKVSLRNFFEVMLEALYKQAKQIIGKEAPRYFPVIGTLAIFIFFSNVLGLVPGFTPPTDN